MNLTAKAGELHSMHSTWDKAAVQVYCGFAAIIFLFLISTQLAELNTSRVKLCATTDHLAKQCAIEQARAHRYTSGF